MLLIETPGIEIALKGPEFQSGWTQSLRILDQCPSYALSRCSRGPHRADRSSLDPAPSGLSRHRRCRRPRLRRSGNTTSSNHWCTSSSEWTVGGIDGIEALRERSHSAASKPASPGTAFRISTSHHVSEGAFGVISGLGMLLAVSLSDDRLKFSLHLFFGQVQCQMGSAACLPRTILGSARLRVSGWLVPATL